jgi:V/A-type H+-transporting ATPase subunit I
VAFGVAVVSLGLVLNIMNAILTRDHSRLLLDRYGLVGIWFYWGLVFIGLEYATKGGVSALSVVVLLVVPLFLLALREPLLDFARGHGSVKNLLNPLLVFQSGIETFDTALRYFTNTLSYIRLAAFAISHAGMGLMVFTFVAMLRQVPGGEPLALVVGNAFVIALEGLVVSIQALRLDYYEFFTKFFQGDGIPFRPLVIPDIRGSGKE